MKVKTKIKQEIEIDIEPEEAFRILCKSLGMDFVLDEDREFMVYKNQYEENSVYEVGNGPDMEIDERGNLFVSLRNVAVNMFPNLYFRNDDYIMEYQNKKVDDN